ncbi:hypothetical protein PUN28_003234 [Cardiocondyla obscurior]|uniref:Uncharacterized protein n=1 Tax=Cardiocondyla obscurior TaxID=286306 RepID=A0AAW2GMR0_9HYME
MVSRRLSKQKKHRLEYILKLYCLSIAIRLRFLGRLWNAGVAWWEELARSAVRALFVYIRPLYWLHLHTLTRLKRLYNANIISNIVPNFMPNIMSNIISNIIFNIL